MDLAAIEALVKRMEIYTLEKGYVEAAVQYYEEYGQLMGIDFKPEEAYLNAMGYNYMQEGKVEKAVNTYGVAVRFYPNSLNGYDNYARGLIALGRKEEALTCLEKSLEVAKEMGDASVDAIQKKIEGLRREMDVSVQGQ